MKFTTKSV